MKILDNIKACIFDLDGTIIDSMWMWRKIDEEYLERFDITCPNDLDKELEGKSFTETAIYFKEKFHINDSIERIKSDWEAMAIDKYRNDVRLKNGALDFLKLLKRKNMPLAIATSNSVKLVDTVMQALDIRHYFDTILTACEVDRGKPFPDVYLKVSEILKVAPVDCLVFEDIPAGIMAGKAAGMKVCAIEDDFSLHMTDEKKALSDYYIIDYTYLE